MWRGIYDLTPEFRTTRRLPSIDALQATVFLKKAKSRGGGAIRPDPCYGLKKLAENYSVLFFIYWEAGFLSLTSNLIVTLSFEAGSSFKLAGTIFNAAVREPEDLILSSNIFSV